MDSKQRQSGNFLLALIFTCFGFFFSDRFMSYFKSHNLHHCGTVISSESINFDNIVFRYYVSPLSRTKCRQRMLGLQNREYYRVIQNSWQMNKTVVQIGGVPVKGFLVFVKPGLVFRSMLLWFILKVCPIHRYFLCLILFFLV